MSFRTLPDRSPDKSFAKVKTLRAKTLTIAFCGAGDGNRTRVFSLGNFGLPEFVSVR